MHSQPLRNALIYILLVILAACAANPGDVDQPPALSTGPLTPQANFKPPPPAGQGPASGSATWPVNIPPDIPPLDGPIRLVMEAPGSHIRIFYNAMSRSQIDAYLAGLKQAGFHLEYIVFTTAGFPDNSQERLQRGDYDAVDITRGDYHMRLDYGDTPIYDVYTSGWGHAPVQKQPTKAPAQWPPELTGELPSPDGCDLGEVVNINGGGYRLKFTCDSKDADLAYLQSLKALNFLEQDKLLNENGEIVSITLSNGRYAVKLQRTFTTTFFVYVRPSMQ